MNATELSLSDFWRRFILVEQQTRALSRRFGTLQLFALQRTRIFYAIAEELKIFDNPHPHFEKPILGDGIPELTRISELSKSDCVVVPFRRRVSGADPYSDAVLERLRRQGRNVRVIDFMPRLADDGTLVSKEGEELDLERLKAYFAKSQAAAVARIMKYTSRRPQVQAWQRLISAFEDEFGIELEKFQKYPQWLVRRTLAERRGFANLFKTLATRDLYIVNAYSEPSIVLGAHAVGVKVHEIQHGFISPFHPAYSFDLSLVPPSKPHKRPRLDAAPDTILTWGSYWGQSVGFARRTSLQVIGPTAPFQRYRQAALGESRIVPRQVLFTSQGAIAKELFAAALETARVLPNHNIIYRLHPNESLADFEALLTADFQLTGSAKPKNFSLSHRDPIFLDLVSRSEYLIGAFSTTLFEGLALGCKVLVLKISGFENVMPAILDGDITLVDSLDELSAALAAARPAKHPEKYYAKEEDD